MFKSRGRSNDSNSNSTSSKNNNNHNSNNSQIKTSKSLLHLRFFLTLGKLVFAIAFFNDVGVVFEAAEGVTPYRIRTAEPAPSRGIGVVESISINRVCLG